MISTSKVFAHDHVPGYLIGMDDAGKSDNIPSQD